VTVRSAIVAASPIGNRYAPVEIDGNASERMPFATAT